MQITSYNHQNSPSFGKLKLNFNLTRLSSGMGEKINHIAGDVKELAKDVDIYISRVENPNEGQDEKVERTLYDILEIKVTKPNNPSQCVTGIIPPSIGGCKEIFKEIAGFKFDLLEKFPEKKLDKIA